MVLLDPLYRLLGLVAALDGRFRKVHVNGIPANVGLFILLAVGAYAGFERYTEATRNGSAPTALALADLLTRTSEPQQQFVSVRGVLESGPRFEDRGKTWAPLLDRTSGRALLVQLSPERARAGAAEAVEITGMLRPMDARMRGETTYGILRHSAAPIDQQLLLVEGDVPAGSRLALAIGLTSVALFLLLAIALIKRDVIFMPVSTSEPIIPPTGEVALFLSGRIRFDETTAQRVVNMPAVVGRWPSGDVAIGDGAWMLTMRPGSATNVERGYVYAGARRLRAIRFRYVSAFDDATEQAVLGAIGGDPMAALQ